jgi:hypothetical protein
LDPILYIICMNRSSQYLLLAALLFSLAALFGPGTQADQPVDFAAPMASIRPADGGRPAPAPTQARFKPARKSDRVERVSFPGIAEQPICRSSIGLTPELLPDTPPSQKFLTGVFHRYRPRDPTLS